MPGWAGSGHQRARDRLLGRSAAAVTGHSASRMVILGSGPEYHVASLFILVLWLAQVCPDQVRGVGVIV